MVIEISQTILYISIVVALILIVLVICFIKRFKSDTVPNYIGDRTDNMIDGNNPKRKDKRQEQKRREQASKRIEAKISVDLEEQKKIFKSYIWNLNYHIGEIDKKIFFNVTRLTDTNPSYLFNVLKSAFKISKDETVYYCRRNSSTFGADDYFIITEDGFHCGDSNGEYGNGLMFDRVSKVENVGCCIQFLNSNNELLENLAWEYVLYRETIQEKEDFVDATNKFLSGHKTEEEILIDAALEAADEKAIPILSRLTEKLGVDNPIKQFVRAAYHYVLAEDGVNTNHHLELCNYAIADVEEAAKKISIDEGVDVKSNYLYGMCEIIKTKIALLSNGDSYDIEQSIKELMGSGYHQDVRDEASRLLMKINRNN